MGHVNGRAAGVKASVRETSLSLKIYYCCKDCCCSPYLFVVVHLPPCQDIKVKLMVHHITMSTMSIQLRRWWWCTEIYIYLLSQIIIVEVFPGGQYSSIR